MKKVAFICVHNACRSQIAEALCRKFRPDLEPYSAGTKLKDVVDLKMVGIMKDFYGIEMENYHPKLLGDIPVCDIYVSMGCGVTCPTIKSGFSFDFQIDDPTGKTEEEYIRVIEEIKKKIDWL